MAGGLRIAAVEYDPPVVSFGESPAKMVKESLEDPLSHYVKISKSNA